MRHIVRSVGVEEGVNCHTAYMCCWKFCRHRYMPVRPVEHLAGAVLKGLKQIIGEGRWPQPEHWMHSLI